MKALLLKNALLWLEIFQVFNDLPNETIIHLEASWELSKNCDGSPQI